MRSARRSFAVALALSLAVGASPAIGRADSDEGSLSFPYPKFRPAEYVATGLMGAGWFGVFFLAHGTATPHWTGGILFDDAVRSAVRLRSPQARDAARSTSDLTAMAAAVLTLGVDALAVPLLRGRPDVAWQAVLMDAQSFALSGLLTTSTYYSTGRARPSYEDCQRDPSFDPLCRTGATSSFWSGHTSGAFTAAGLSCAHHVHLHLYGHKTADALGCAGMITLASTTGTLRVLGDRHFATDVLTGALVGFAIGYGLPTVLHYSARAGTEVTILPASQGTGVTVTGAF